MPATAIVDSFTLDDVHAAVNQFFSLAVNDNPVLM
jgi:hypothetical protein